MAGVEGNAVLLGDGRIEGRLHGVDGGGDEGEGEQSVGIKIVEEAVGGVLAIGEGRVLDEERKLVNVVWEW